MSEVIPEVIAEGIAEGIADGLAAVARAERAEVAALAGRRDEPKPFVAAWLRLVSPWPSRQPLRAYGEARAGSSPRVGEMAPRPERMPVQLLAAPPSSSPNAPACASSCAGSCLPCRPPAPPPGMPPSDLTRSIPRALASIRSRFSRSAAALARIARLSRLALNSAAALPIVSTGSCSQRPKATAKSISIFDVPTLAVLSFSCAASMSTSISAGTLHGGSAACHIWIAMAQEAWAGGEGRGRGSHASAQAGRVAFHARSQPRSVGASHRDDTRARAGGRFTREAAVHTSWRTARMIVSTIESLTAPSASSAFISVCSVRAASEASRTALAGLPPSIPGRRLTSSGMAGGAAAARRLGTTAPGPAPLAPLLAPP